MNPPKTPNNTKKGINISIADARFAKPLDENLIWQLATDHEAIITIEEGSIGGFGSHVAKFLFGKKGDKIYIIRE